MNKFKLLITNCKSKINSLLNRVRGKEITHIIVTSNGDKIKCYDSIELYDEENKIMVIKCQIGMKNCLITINSDNIEYTIEKYTDDIWNSILNMPEIKNEIVDDRLYT